MMQEAVDNCGPMQVLRISIINVEVQTAFQWRGLAARLGISKKLNVAKKKKESQLL